MPIKRKTDGEQAPPKKRAALRRKRAPVASAAPDGQAHGAMGGTEPVISQDEKRRLIMAHAAMRPTRDPVQFMSMWAGVLVAITAIVAGWWWSVGSTIAGSVENGVISDGFQELVPDRSRRSEIERELERTSERLRALREQAEAQQQVMRALQGEVSGGSGAFMPPSQATTTSGTIEQ